MWSAVERRDVEGKWRGEDMAKEWEANQSYNCIAP